MNNKVSNGNGSRVFLFVVLSWCIIIGLVANIWHNTKETKAVKSILREQFEKQVYTSKILNNFETASHSEVVDVLFKEWIKHRRKD